MRDDYRSREPTAVKAEFFTLPYGLKLVSPVFPSLPTFS